MSPVPAKIILDLRESLEDQNTNGIDCLELSPMIDNENNDSSIMKSIDNEHEIDDEREEYILFINLMEIV